MEKITIKVSSDVLLAVSEEVSRSISKAKAAFEKMERLVNESSSFWEGRGHDAHLNAYQKQQDRIRVALSRFTENVTDLQTIAGVYKATEEEDVKMSDPLLTDVII